MDQNVIDNIDKLYRNYEILSSAGNKVFEHEKEYKEILAAVKGSDKEKRLASQFIVKFLKHFPNLADNAIDAQLDLCEDSDVQIRRQAIKDLPQICKDTKEHTSKIGDILSQLLITEDSTELQQVHMSLQALAKYDAKGTLAGLINQIMTGDEITRDRCLRFLAYKFSSFGPELITKEVEDNIIHEIKKILQDVTAEEFHLCMMILGSTNLGKTVSGHLELVNLSIEQADMGVDLNAATIDDEVVERFIQCATHALPYFSSKIESTQFIKFLCEKLLPITTWSLIGAAEQDQQLRILKLLAEMSAHCGTLENPAEKVEAIFNLALEYMPIPPLNADGELIDTPSFQFSHAECLLFSLHSLGRQSPNFLTFPNDQNKLKDFRSRLQYLARGTQGYIKKLQESLKNSDDSNSEETQIKTTALKTTSNISTLIRDLFHSPPSFKSKIQLSWVARKMDTSPIKRHAPITFGADNNGKANDREGTKKSRNNDGAQRVYTPPSGKYSNKVQMSGTTRVNSGRNVGNVSQGSGNRSRNSSGFRSGNRNRVFRRY